MLIKQANKKSTIFVTTSIFLNKGFKFQPHVWNRCHDLSMTSMNLSNITILKIKNADYRQNAIIREISKSEAINLLENIDFIKKRRILKKN